RPPAAEACGTEGGDKRETHCGEQAGHVSARQGLDAEAAPLKVRIAGERVCRLLGCDLAADHDQLPFRERGRDAEVLLDQEDAETLLLEMLEHLDQVL